MSYRLLTVALMASGVAFATQSYAETTTVKSSKSNTSDRMGGGGGGKGAAGTAIIQPSGLPSINTTTGADRMGGGGGGKGAVQLNPQPEPPGRTK
jgi:hypothetical protein